MKLFTREAKLSGRGRLIAKHADGTQSVLEDHNDLLDGFFSWLSSSPTWPDDAGVTMKIGTGTSPTILTNTTVEAVMPLVGGVWPVCQVNGGDLAEVIDGGATLLAKRQYVATFVPGQVVGTVTEYGLDFTGVTISSDGTVSTRVLTLDGDGNPAGLVLEETDQLVIEYNIELRIPTADRVESVLVNLSGATQTHTCTTRFGKLAPFHHYMGLTVNGSDADDARVIVTTDLPMGDAFAPVVLVDDPSAKTAAPYSRTSNGVKEVDVIMEGETNNHAGGIVTMLLGSGDSPYKFGWDPALPKDDTRRITFKLGLTFTR